MRPVNLSAYWRRSRVTRPQLIVFDGTILVQYLLVLTTRVLSICGNIEVKQYCLPIKLRLSVWEIRQKAQVLKRPKLHLPRLMKKIKMSSQKTNLKTGLYSKDAEVIVAVSLELFIRESCN